jgi:hypothetical protein
MLLHVTTFIRLILIALILIIIVFSNYSVLSTIPFILPLVIIYIFTSKKLSARQPLIILLSFNLIFYYGLRLADYSVVSHDLIASFFDIGTILNSERVIYPLLYLSSIIVSAYAGLILSSFPYAKGINNKFEYSRFPKLKGLVDLTFFYSIFYILVMLPGAEFVRYSGFFTKIFMFFFQLDVIFSMLLFYIFIRVGRSNQNKAILLLIVFYILMRMIGGSRSGPIDALIIWLSVFASLMGNNIYINLTFKFFIYICLSFIVAITLYFFVAYIRAEQYGMLNSGNGLSGTYDSLILIYTSISYRIGTNLDTFLFMFSGYWDNLLADRLVNFYTTLISIIERIFHINIDNNVAPTEYTLTQLIGAKGYGDGEHELLTAYSWGFIAYFHQLFNLLSILASFLFFYVTGQIYIYFYMRGTEIKNIFIAIFISYFMQIFISTFGLDNLIDRSIRYIASFIVLFLIARFFSRIRLTSPS